MSEENGGTDIDNNGGTPAPTDGGTPTPTPAATPTPAEPTTNWRDAITDEGLRSVAERYNSPTDAIKAVADLRKQVSTSIRMPGKDATPEDIQKFYKAIGVPDAPDGYKFQLPEGRELTDADKAFQAEMAKAFHETGVSAQAAGKLNQVWNDMQVKAEQSMIDADKQFAAQSEAQLKQKWGQDYDRNVTLANRAATELFENLDSAKKIEMKDGRFLMDHPVMLEMLAKVGGEMAEDGFRRLDANETATLQQQADDLGKQKMDAYSKGDRETAKRLDEQQRKIMEKLYPNK